MYKREDHNADMYLAEKAHAQACNSLQKRLLTSEWERSFTFLW
jgi:hypothetical protein